MITAGSDAVTIAERCRFVRSRIDAAARRARRDPASVTLVAVTKSVEPAAIRHALAAGIRDFGESYVQEAIGKIPRVAEQWTEPDRPRWHLIGHLQRNKAAAAVPLFDLMHALDSEELALRLDRIGAQHDRMVRALLQINVAGESTKSGVAVDAAAALIERVWPLRHLRVEGLMAIPPAPRDPEDSRPHFQALAALASALGARGFDLVHLSMGMTADYEVAVEEGATLVRVGEAIFGPRPDRSQRARGAA